MYVSNQLRKVISRYSSGSDYWDLQWQQDTNKMNELPSHSQSTTVISTGQSVWWDVLPDQCTVQQQGQQWSCPQFHRYDETPSHPSLPAVTSCKPGSTPSPIRSDSLSAAGSCRPSYRWPPVLSLDWSPSDRHCDTTITAEHVSSEKNTTQMFLQVINISKKNKRFINKLCYQCATAVLGNIYIIFHHFCLWICPCWS